VFERDGCLRVDGQGRKDAKLTPLGRGRYRIEGGGELVLEPVAVRLDGDRLPRHDFGAEVEAGIRAAVRADPGRPAGQGPGRQAAGRDRRAPAADLVDLSTLDPTIRLDIRYAGSDNFMGLPLYERSAAYMQRPAALALARAAQGAEAQGYGLLIHDAYRPWFVTWMFWEATPPEDHMFVADPAQGSRHNRGCAVDLTLYDLKTGQPVEMPSRYDEMSGRSYADFIGGTTKQRAMRSILREAMVAQGFEVYPEEWWHFDYKDWRQLRHRHADLQRAGEGEVSAISFRASVVAAPNWVLSKTHQLLAPPWSRRRSARPGAPAVRRHRTSCTSPASRAGGDRSGRPAAGLGGGGNHGGIGGDPGDLEGLQQGLGRRVEPGRMARLQHRRGVVALRQAARKRSTTRRRTSGSAAAGSATARACRPARRTRRGTGQRLAAVDQPPLVGDRPGTFTANRKPAGVEAAQRS
jgi:D-alanyl-D-alanine dipeptidase